MQLSNIQYAQVVNKPEIVGQDFEFTSLISPLVDLTSSIIGNWGGSKSPTPPPPPKVPWVPIAVGGGLMMTMVMVLAMKR